MTAPDLFDGYADTYAATVDRSIEASGESVEFFAHQKAALTRRHVAGRAVRRVLDFGCGTGLSTRALAQAFPGEVELLGVDPSADSIDRAQRASGGDPRVRHAWMAGEQIPCDDASVDVAFAACVFHHIERRDHVAWLERIRRALRPGGVLLIFEHNPYNPLTRRAVRLCPFDEGVALLRPGYTRELTRAAGFQPERPRYYFFFPAALRALRAAEPALARVPVGAQYFVAARVPG